MRRDGRNETKERTDSRCSFKEGEVSVDATGKMNGRGAYLSLDKETILAAKNKRSLHSNFRHRLTNTFLKNY